MLAQAARRRSVAISRTGSRPSSSAQLIVNVKIMAGIISLLNDYRLSIGRPPLGWLNPWLYGGGLAGLNDVTLGSNPGCGTPGFTATFGWDPVSLTTACSLSTSAHSGMRR